MAQVPELVLPAERIARLLDERFSQIEQKREEERIRVGILETKIEYLEERILKLEERLQ